MIGVAGDGDVQQSTASPDDVEERHGRSVVGTEGFGFIGTIENFHQVGLRSGPGESFGVGVSHEKTHFGSQLLLCFVECHNIYKRFQGAKLRGMCAQKVQKERIRNN